MKNTADKALQERIEKVFVQKNEEEKAFILGYMTAIILRGPSAKKRKLTNV